MTIEKDNEQGFGEPDQKVEVIQFNGNGINVEQHVILEGHLSVDNLVDGLNNGDYSTDLGYSREGASSFITDNNGDVVAEIIGQNVDLEDVELKDFTKF